MAVNRTKSEAFMLRFPDGLRDRIRWAAEANSRSMNSEIIATLEATYPDSKEQLRRALDVIDGAIESSDPKDQPRLREARQQLMAALYFEPIEDEK